MSCAWCFDKVSRPVLAGVVAGTALSAAGARVMQTLVFGTAPVDPASFALAGARRSSWSQ